MELDKEVVPEKPNKVEQIQEKDPVKEEVKESLEEVNPVVPTSKLSSKVKVQIERIKKLDRENQIKELCNLSFLEDLDFAVSVAKGLSDAYVLDEFHDALVDNLYDKLIEENKLKKM